VSEEQNRRATDSVADELDAIRGLIAANSEAAQQMNKAMIEMINGYMKRIDSFVHETPCPHLQAAVPNGDYKGHGDYHAGLIELDKRIADLKWHTVKVVSVGFLAWLGVLIWNGLLVGPK